VHNIELAPGLRMGEVGAVNLSEDRRRKRGEESRGRISTAFIEIVGEGTVAPTATEIARRAKVGRRSVFRHFRDMDALYCEMTQHASCLLHRALKSAGTTEDIASRLAEMIHVRRCAYEQIMPFQIAAQAHRHQSIRLRVHLQNFADLQRTSVLQHLPQKLFEDRARTEAIDLALSFDTWVRLRREQQLSPEAAERVVVTTCAALLERCPAADL